MSHHKKPAHHIRPYKIAAQTAGLVACIFVLIFIGGKGAPDILKNDQNEWMPFMPFLLLAFGGYIIAWFWEFAGTLMMTAGGVMLLGFFISKGDSVMGLIYGLPFILAGLIFLIHINKRIQLKRKQSNT